MADLYESEFSASPFQAVGRGIASVGRSMWSDWTERANYAKMAGQAVQSGDMETGAFLSLRALGIRAENPASIAGGLMGIRGGVGSPSGSVPRGVIARTLRSFPKNVRNKLKGMDVDIKSTPLSGSYGQASLDKSTGKWTVSLADSSSTALKGKYDPHRILKHELEHVGGIPPSESLVAERLVTDPSLFDRIAERFWRRGYRNEEIPGEILATAAEGTTTKYSKSGRPVGVRINKETVSNYVDLMREYDQRTKVLERSTKPEAVAGPVRSKAYSKSAPITPAKEFIKQLPEGKLSAFDKIRLSRGGMI